MNHYGYFYQNDRYYFKETPIMQLKFGFKTDIGRKRSQNQDNGKALPEIGLFVVADGMGGHRGGEIASSIAVNTISSFVATQVQENSKQLTPETAEKLLQKAILEANQTIIHESKNNPTLNGMGTTVVATLFYKKRLIIGHVGDSRCYFLKSGAIWQLTRDHSLVQEKLRAGLINRNEAKTDRMKNIITRAVGFDEKLEVDLYKMTLQTGDLFLLCSDGLSSLLDDSNILNVIEKTSCSESPSLQNTACALVDKANEMGGDDNITSLLVQVV